MEDINFYSSLDHKKWLIETVFPRWQNTLKYWDCATEATHTVNTASHVAEQSYFRSHEGRELTKIIRDYANECVERVGAPFRLGERTLAWRIAYEPGGWQAIHKHGIVGESASVVLCVEGAGDWSGKFHFLLPESDGTIEVGVAEQKPGSFIVVESSTLNGAYPCDSPKRVYVMDFKLDYTQS